MGNPILTEMLSFTFNESAHCWESHYRFQPSPELLSFLETVPKGRAVLYDHTSVYPDLKFMFLDPQTPGVRVKVGDTVIYLTVGFPDRDSLSPSFAVHDRLLHYRLYYPREEDILEYWRDPSDALNNAADYIKPVARSRYLASIIREHCAADAKTVLEIGCNVGRNLTYLKGCRYQVSGIEISDAAVTLLRSNYPQLADTKIYVGDAKRVLRTIPDDSFDLVFSMAVLMHIHPTVDDSFWQDIVRIAKKNIVTIENEGSSSGRNWARNYAECFGAFGAICTHAEYHDNNEHLLHTYTTRVFDCSKKKG